MRFPLIDQIRGFAVLIMIIFHLFYDLASFQFLQIDFYTPGFWYFYPRLIVFLFLICVGLSSYVSHRDLIDWNKIFKRFLKLASIAIGISLITYLVFPQRWIYFGTIHCIALCSLTSILFLKYPKLSLIIGLSILVLHIFSIIQIPWIKLDHPAMDYIPFFPWIGVTLLGVYLASINFHKIKTPNNRFFSLLSLLGRHALIIYLVHQPILFTATLLLKKLVG